MARLSGLELTLENWRELLVSLEEPIYRAEQIGDWIYRKKIFTFEGMTNLPRELRSKLDNAVDLRLPELVKETSSFRDGTRKFLWRLEDGATVESVFLPHSSHRTACLSSQVGCALGCSFCATGQGGFVRDMTAGEIVGHLLAMEHHVGMSVQNVVLMGMGEPLLNTTEVFKALGMIHEPGMRNMGVRHMAISTAGIVPGIDALAAAGVSSALDLPADKSLVFFSTAAGNSSDQWFIVDSAPELTGSMLEGAQTGFDQFNQPKVDMQFNDEGARVFADVTTKLSETSQITGQDQRLAIVLDGNVESAPRVLEPIEGGSAEITGKFTQEEAKSLALVLQTGALPVELKAVSLAFLNVTVLAISKKRMSFGLEPGQPPSM